MSSRSMERITKQQRHCSIASTRTTIRRARIMALTTGFISTRSPGIARRAPASRKRTEAIPCLPWPSSISPFRNTTRSLTTEQCWARKTRDRALRRSTPACSPHSSRWATSWVPLSVTITITTSSVRITRLPWPTDVSREPTLMATWKEACG